MEFLPEIYVPYGPYMDFSTDNATNRVHIWTFYQKYVVRTVHICTFQWKIESVWSKYGLWRGKMIEDFEIQNFDENYNFLNCHIYSFHAFRIQNLEKSKRTNFSCWDYKKSRKNFIKWRTSFKFYCSCLFAKNSKAKGN